MQSCLETASIGETVLAYRPGKHLQRPLDIYRAVESELLKADRNLNGHPSVRLFSEAEKVMQHFRKAPAHSGQKRWWPFTRKERARKEKVNPKGKDKRDW